MFGTYHIILSDWMLPGVTDTDNLQFADPDFVTPSKIDILLAEDTFSISARPADWSKRITKCFGNKLRLGSC